MSFVLEFSGLVLTGRSFEVKIKDRASDTTRATLTNGSGITISSAAKLEVAYARSGMTSWPRGEYTADIVDITGGARSRIMAVRFVLDLPGRLVQGVQDRKAYINWSPTQAVVTSTGAVGPAGPQGIQGPQGNTGATGATGNTGAAGPANSLAVGTVTNGAPGSAAATITGASPSQTLNLTLPQGLPGNGGNTSEVLGAAGITEQPNLVFDAVRNEYFARGTGNYSSALALVAALGGVSTFARASTATYFDSDGLLKTAANNALRIEYDPVTRACRGLLIENQARTNLFTYSEQINDASYTKVRASINANVAVAPDGLSTADKIVEDNTATNTHLTTKSATVVSASVYTVSMFAKAGERGQVQVQFDDGSAATYASAKFNLSTGSISSLSGTGATAFAIDCGNGWWRIEVTGTTTSTTGRVVTYLLDSSGNATYSGDNASGLFAWGYQLELGSRASSYIATVASAVTRSADSLALAGASWISSAALAFLVEARLNETRGSGTTSSLVFFANSGNTNTVYVREGTVISGADLIVLSGGVTSVDSGSYATPTATTMRFAAGYDASGWGFAKDNALTFTGGATTAPVVLDRLFIGTTGFMGHIRRILVWPQRLSNAKVQAASNITWPSSIVSPPAIPDGNKGDITVSSGGSIWTIGAGAVNDVKVASPATAADGVSSTKIAFQQAGTSPVWRTVRDKMRDRVSVLDFGADLTGATSSSAAFNNALATGADVDVPKGTYGFATTVRVPARQSLLIDGAAVIKPLANVDVLRASQASRIIGGTVDTSALSGWNQAAVLIDGSDYSTNGFWMHDLTDIKTNLKGAFGSNTGTAVYFNAASSTTARVMGVNVDARVWGFEVACYLRVGSTPGSNFITSNRIKVMSSESVRALYCVDPGLYDIAGNEISIHHQPRAGVTVPSVDFIGQMNDLFLLPWDWDGVVATSPYAIVLKSGSRFNRIRAPISSAHISDVSAEKTNVLISNDYNVLGGKNAIVGTLYPPYYTGIKQNSVAIYAGGDAPSNSFGVDGDFYFRGGGGAGSCIYQKRAGVWYATGA